MTRMARWRKELLEPLPEITEERVISVVNKWCPECDTMIPVEDYVAHQLDTHCTRVGCDRTSIAIEAHHPKHCPLGQPF